MPHSIDDYLTRLEAHGFSGNVVVVEQGKLLLNKGYGLINEKPGHIFTDQTPFPIASITKPITAAAVLLLDQKDKVRINNQIDLYFEDVPDDKKKITIHHLLTHTSGLPRDAQKTSRDKLLRIILDSKLIHPVGKQFAYSNAGYQLLGLLIEKITGDTYEQFILTHLFQPFNLTCTFENDSSAWKQLPRAFDESQVYTIFKKNYQADNKIGSGGIVCTITDLYKWFTTVLNRKILKEMYLKEAFSQQVKIDDDGNYSGYGYGFYLNFTNPEDRIIIHGGDIFGYHSELRWHKDQNRLIILFTNKELYGLGVHKRVIVSNINKLMNGNEINQPDKFEAVSADEIRTYAGIYKLDEENFFHVWEKNNKLMIGAEGQEAINFLAVHNQDQKEFINQKNESTKEIVAALVKGRKDILKKLFTKSTYNFFVPYWLESLENLRKEYGKLKKVIVKGSIAYPWQEKYIRCYTYYVFENKTVDISFIWNQNKLYETLEQSGFPYPVIMPLVKHSGNMFAVFDLVTSKGQSIRFKDQKLIIEVDSKTIFANKT
ncbi:MAG: serine hydrolase [Candidatus Aminicenantes bacterium]|nr:serine hydrolase [Candidatus Aminicenantes bacterium]